jgi:hypothetical protein
MTIFLLLLIKAKHQHEKYHNKNPGWFINCMDFVVVRTKMNKKKNRNFFFVMLGPWLPTLLATHFVDDHMEKVLSGVQT